MNASARNTSVVENVVQINAFKALSILQAQKGKIITLDYIRKDGVWRTLNGRLGVSKFTKGGVSASVKPENSLFTFYSFKDGYRALAVDRLMSFRAGGTFFQVV